ncbi:hypothetical protein H261_00560 [Paramagnetospirillum caucaseum]|uniref:Uncharacterized protein n=1 Tax=Paramagnetospirillum caucaseum TaxID=1244869 RepID=M2ZC65_9PROT|nr:hypothetical protein [Paramagnetospirillum caucaseum]EME72025.1 hypothetical protein H261_00560 [Paramagnetospirillum caucaseum]
MLRERYPWHITIAADAEGYQFLQSVLAGCRGQLEVTDNGGGEVTSKHLEAVFHSSLGYGAFTVWTTEQDDISIIRATLHPSDSTPRALEDRFPAKVTFYIDSGDIEDFACRFEMTDNATYAVMVGGVQIQDGDHLLDVADEWGEVPVMLCQVGPRQAPDEIRCWLDQHDQDCE